jgi:hypothetical protein
MGCVVASCAFSQELITRRRGTASVHLVAFGAIINITAADKCKPSGEAERVSVVTATVACHLGASCGRDRPDMRVRNGLTDSALCFVDAIMDNNDSVEYGEEDLWFR